MLSSNENTFGWSAIVIKQVLSTFAVAAAPVPIHFNVDALMRIDIIEHGISPCVFSRPAAVRVLCDGVLGGACRNIPPSAHGYLIRRLPFLLNTVAGSI